MKILIVGPGARDHALAWKLQQDAPSAEFHLAPGNPGSHALGTAVDIAADDADALSRYSVDHSIDLVVVGPEVSLAAGLADRLADHHIAVFGPTRAAAEIEWSKAWAKAFMQRHDIPTAAHASFDNATEAEDYLASLPRPPVVKDDGLASGKGVTVAETREEALLAVRAIFAGRPSARVVLEERLHGWETSALAFCDGRDVAPLPLACDFKRVYDADQGPNTGGMGAYAPAVVTPDLRREILERILKPAATGMASEGRPFVGMLYAGLMITSAGPKVIEFNCRFGDPECQALLPLLDSGLLELIEACIQGRLSDVSVRWSAQSCCAVVIASPGYPANPRAMPMALPILGDGIVAFQGGASGRVMTISALGPNLAQAHERAYEAVRSVAPPEAHYRSDIGTFDRAQTPVSTG